jgi:UDP-GlcNAc:undecaprenyl-phosphate GlcNAc-1-phosphate transferase
MVGFALTSWRHPAFLAEWWPVILCNVLIFTIGFLDDLRPLGARVKLLGQVGTACILFSLDVSIEDLTNPFRSGAHFHLGIWSFPVTVAWLVAIPNLINLIDGMDGLAAGFGLLLCVTLACLGHFGMRPDMVLISVVMSGALAGFLVFNFPPAKIYLGDGGDPAIMWRYIPGVVGVLAAVATTGCAVGGWVLLGKVRSAAAKPD